MANISYFEISLSINELKSAIDFAIISMCFEEPLLLKQQIYLYQPFHLADLLNKIEPPSLFAPEDPVLNPHYDNISFGPIEYSFQLRVKENSNMNVICICLLQYIFESKCDKAQDVYEKLIDYIINHDVSYCKENVIMSPNEVRTYIVKFLFSLERKRGTSNIIY